jgi:hypothetical protein
MPRVRAGCAGRGLGRWVVVAVIGASAVVVGGAVAVGGAFRMFGGPLVATSAQAADPPVFVEEARAAGLEHIYDGEFEFFVGGGIAALDCNADGRADLYIAGGAKPAGLFRNESSVGGSLRFEAVHDRATDLDLVTGAYPLDIDGDGNIDLAVLRHGENVLLRGLGDCRFERANEAWGFDGGDVWTTAFSATWEGSSTLPTLAFGNYRNEASNDINKLCFDNELVRPAAAGGRYDAATPLAPGWCALSMLFSDWSRSGQRDLRVSNDQHYYGPYTAGQEELWRIRPAGTPRLYTEEKGWRRLHIWGMGIASQDLTGDGLPEIFLTNQGDNKLQTLADGPSRPAYEDIAIERRATAHKPYVGDVTMRSTAWHAEFQDVNNDGYVDLYVAKGNVEAMPDYAARDPSNLLIGQPDGTFVEGAEDAGIVTFARGRGGALVDLNLDGLLDLVQVNRRVNVSLWRSVGAGNESASAPMGHWVGMRLDQPAPNRDAIGAWIEVRCGDGKVMRREVTVGGGHASGELGWRHFGLGDADKAEIRVIWPDGTASGWQSVDSDSFYVLERGKPAKEWMPK